MRAAGEGCWCAVLTLKVYRNARAPLRMAACSGADRSLEDFLLTQEDQD